MTVLETPQPVTRNPPPTENVVVVRGLTKVFKDFWGRPKARAVDNVDFEVRPGEVFGLLGPNGSGKSTTVKLLLGLLYPTKGHIEVFGHSPRHVATKSRIGYLNPIIAALLHNAGSLVVVFNSARLVRIGEDLEPFQAASARPADKGPGRGAEPVPQLTPKPA